MPRRVYLDHAATAPLRSEVRAAVEAWLAQAEGAGNPASLHWAGRAAREALERGRAQVAALFAPAGGGGAGGGGGDVEVVFTSGGTEANHLALRGLAPLLPASRASVAVAAVEHSSVLAAARALAREGVRVETVPVDAAGLPDLDALRAALGRGAGLVSVAAGNNETGNAMPVAQVAVLCRSAGALFHADAVQAAGWVEVGLGGDAAAGPDALTVSAHKLGGLPGTGALALRRGLRLRALLDGGDQERGARAGTPALAGIVAFGEAARLAAAERAEAAPRVTALRRRLEEGVRARVPGTTVHGHPERRLPHIANFGFEGAEGDMILLNLDLDGVAASAGSACVAGRTEPSHVLLAMGLSPEQARGAVRMSLGRATHGGDVDRVLEVLPDIVARVRAAGT
ncbi:MAG TPA: cysteine desulfurase family protein [Myxococcota bacterium]|nr:cysteine desulfurase family protein [Myxococcota bacterium]